MRCEIQLALVLLAGCERGTWVPAHDPGEVDGGLRGLASCGDDAADCNPCATNVRHQFDTDSWTRGKAEWHYDPEGSYGVLLKDAWGDSLRDAKDHAQAFVRLNGSTRFAMVHSGTTATVSIVTRAASGRFELDHIRRVDACDGHTSGAFVLGRYVGFFPREGHLAFLDVGKGASGPQVEYYLSVPDPRVRGLSPRSGGVAMVKLADGDYLLLANEGGDGSSSGHSSLFRIAFEEPGLGSANVEPVVTDLGDFWYRSRGRNIDDFHHSENLSLVTECATGDIYSVHVGSSTRFGTTLGLGKTFWRVSQVALGQGGPRLAPVGVYTRSSDLERCFGRAAGSAFVHATHRIELLCHERGHVDPELTWSFWQHLTDGPLEPIVFMAGS